MNKTALLAVISLVMIGASCTKPSVDPQTNTTAISNPQEAITQVFETAYPRERIVVSLDKLEETAARGQVLVGDVLSGNGGLFIAQKTTAGWEIIHEGNGTLACEELLSQSIPLTLIPECVSKEPSSSTEQIESVSVYIDDLTFLSQESYPPKEFAIIQGNAPDGCTTITDPDITTTTDTIIIEVRAERPKGTPCTQALVPFTLSVPLQEIFPQGGEVFIKANDMTMTATLFSYEQWNQSRTL